MEVSSKRELLQLLEELSFDPRETDDSHAYELWEDGEITMTKAGQLYGLRNLHQMIGPFRPKMEEPRRWALSREAAFSCRQKLLKFWYEYQTEIGRISDF